MGRSTRTAARKEKRFLRFFLSVFLSFSLSLFLSFLLARFASGTYMHTYCRHSHTHTQSHFSLSLSRSDSVKYLPFALFLPLLRADLPGPPTRACHHTQTDTHGHTHGHTRTGRQNAPTREREGEKLDFSGSHLCYVCMGVVGLNASLKAVSLFCCSVRTLNHLHYTLHACKKYHSGIH